MFVRQIGNAVPCNLAHKAVARPVAESLRFIYDEEESTDILT